MIPPKYRAYIGLGVALVALVPTITLGTFKGQTQSDKNEAETNRQARLEAVSKSSLSDNCYILNEIVVGQEIIVKGRSQSVCIALSDGSRYGFIEYQKGLLTVTDSFSAKEVKSKISTLGVK